MPRTSEQVAADDALTAAIESVRAAYEHQAGVLVDYAVITAVQSLDDDGEGFDTTIGVLVRDDEVPAYRTMGMIRMAEKLWTVD